MDSITGGRATQSLPQSKPDSDRRQKKALQILSNKPDIDMKMN